MLLLHLCVTVYCLLFSPSLCLSAVLAAYEIHGGTSHTERIVIGEIWYYDSSINRL